MFYGYDFNHHRRIWGDDREQIYLAAKEYMRERPDCTGIRCVEVDAATGKHIGKEFTVARAGTFPIPEGGWITT